MLSVGTVTTSERKSLPAFSTAICSFGVALYLKVGSEELSLILVAMVVLS